MKQHGGTREGTGRKPGVRTSNKIVRFGFRWEPDILDFVLKAMDMKGLVNASAFIMQAAHEKAKKIMQEDFDERRFD